MNDMSLKAKIRNIAREKHISAQAVLQNYLMNRFLYRVSQSEYQNRFVIKGGMLISSIVGIDHRSTMDLDTTLRNLPLTEPAIRSAFAEICGIETDDGIVFAFDSIEPIRDNDEYGGYRVMFHAVYGKINAPMSMDISTGDIITPDAEKRTFHDMFDAGIAFELWSYPLETVLAEKVETILSWGIDNTRPRDFCDVYMLTGCDYDPAIFRRAFAATAEHRGSLGKITDIKGILQSISEDAAMQRRWSDYTRQMPYAAGIRFEETLDAAARLLTDDCVFSI